MPDLNISTGKGGSVYNPYADQTGVSTQAADTTDKVAPGDTIASAADPSLLETPKPLEKPYLAPADRPSLAAPGNPESLYSANPKTGQPELNAQLSGQPLLNEANKKDASFAENFNNLLLSAAQDNQLSSEDVALVKYAYYHPESSLVPQNLKDLAKTIIQAATQQVQEQFNDPEFTPQPDVQSFDNAYTSLYQQDFNAALQAYAEQNGLSDEDVARLIFAQNHPEIPPDPKDAAILKELNATVAGDLNEEYGLPTSLKFTPDTAFFDTQITQNLDNNFSSLLQAYAEANGLSSQDEATINYAFNHPEADIPKSESGIDYKQIAADLGSKATEMTAKADGLPPGYSPGLPTKTYDQMVTGGFIFAVRDLLADVPGASLSKEDQEIVFQLVTGQLDPSDPSIPDSLKKKASEIKQKALEKILAQYGIPAGQFEPDPAYMANATPEVPANLKTMDGSLKHSSQMAQGLQDVLNKMPDGPQKTVYADYLKAISDAIAKLRDVLYLIQQKDSSLSKEMSNWSLNGAQNKNDLNTAKREDQLEKMRQKPKSPALMGLMKFFQKLGPVFGAIMASVMLGPMGLALIVLDMKLQIFEKMMNGVASVVTKIAEKLGASEQTLNGMKTAMKMLVMAAFFLAMGPMAGTGFMTLGPQMISESGICENLAMSFGADPDKAKKIGMYMSMAVGMAITLSMMIVPLPPAAAAAIGRTVAMVTKEISEMFTKILSVVQTVIKSFVNSVVDAAGASQSISSLQTAIKTIASTINEFIQALVKQVKDLVGSLDKASKFPSQAKDAIDDLIKYVDDFTKDNPIGKTARNIGESVVEEVKATATDPLAVAQVFQTAAEVQTGVSNLQRAEWLKKQAKVEELLAQIEAALGELEAMLKNLRQALDNVQAGLSVTGKEINDLNTLMMTLYQKATDSQTQLFNSTA
jgi:hypothetical protein